MKRHLLLVLTLLVVLPLAVLVGFGIALARQEKMRVRARYEGLLSERLADISGGISRLVEARERELEQALSMDTLAPEHIRERVRTHRLLRQVFVLNTDGTLLHPDARSDTVTREENAFLERTASLWESGESFWSPGETQSQLPQQRYVGKGKRARISMAATPTSGWHTWFWGEGLRFIFWLRVPDGHIVGAEVERATIMSDVIGALPVADYSRTPLPEGRIVLTDAQDRPIYQWGTFSPPAKSTPTVTQSLPAPLVSWTFRYYTPPNGVAASLGRTAIFNLVTGLTALTLALIALAAYFYRESARDMRDAARRVTFVNQVSHELKTPLTNIRMYAELLEKRVPADDERARDYVGILVAEAQRLSRLISNVLAFARHRRGKLHLHAQPAVVDEAIGSVLTSFKPALDALGIAVEFEGTAPRQVQLDVDVLEQILCNLINNVEKYATDATKLSIETEQDATTTTVVVTDDGPGISPAQRETIFQPFERLSNKLTDSATGTGIGLTIARQQAALHGGNLVLVPASGGATFKLTLNTPEVT